METTKINYTSPENHEAKRISEMKLLSHENRIKRLLALIEISFMTKKSIKKS